MSFKVEPRRGYEPGDRVVVQVPVQDGFETFAGVVADWTEDGLLEVFCASKGRSVLCQPKWVYSEGCWLT